MSLDIYAKLKGKKIHEYEKLDNAYRYWDRNERFEYGQELTDEVFHMNITHNLTKMASKVPTLDTNLYQIMWRPDEYFKEDKIKLATILPYLKAGFDYLLSHEKQLSKYNPENGWGHYENFTHWLPDYIRACYKWPNAVLEVDR